MVGSPILSVSFSEYLPPPIRPRYGPGLPLRTPPFRNQLQKSPLSGTFFRKTPYTQDLRQTGHFAWRCKTLLYAFPCAIAAQGEQEHEKNARGILRSETEGKLGYSMVR
jgi:hypothetical protein